MASKKRKRKQKDVELLSFTTTEGAVPPFVTDTSKTAAGSLKQLFFEEALDKAHYDARSQLTKRDEKAIYTWYNGKKQDKAYNLLGKIQERRPTEELAEAYKIKDLPKRQKKIIEIWQDHVSLYHRNLAEPR